MNKAVFTSYAHRMNIIIIWLCLIMVGQYIHSKVITVNNSGSNSTLCCTSGTCVCDSLYDALSSIESNTIINITSQTIFLDIHVRIYFDENITITSAVGTTVMCNNAGSVDYYGCIDIVIEGIIWDQCGDISNPLIPGIRIKACSNITIANCTFQYFKVCLSVYITKPSGVINVVNSKFMFNTVSNSSYAQCKSIFSISSLRVRSEKEASVIAIRDSLFYHNGNVDLGTDYKIVPGSFMYFGLKYQPTQSVLIKNTSFISNGIRGIFIQDTAVNSKVVFEKVNVFNNRYGVRVTITGTGSTNSLNIISSRFMHNDNGALLLQLFRYNYTVRLYNTTFGDNTGTGDIDGTALYIFGANSMINISLCNFYGNIGGNSIIYISEHSDLKFPIVFCNASIISSNFTGNRIGSLLQVNKCFLNFYSTSVFQHNSAKSGAAIHIAQPSQITVDDGSTVQFVNNTALLRGGAMYIDLTNCYDHGIVFTNITRCDAISFINNSAKLSGNSIYFNIPNSCKVIRDYTNIHSAAYLPYKFNYTQGHHIIGPAITTTPYEINLCPSAKCDSINSTYSYSNACVSKNNIMLGESVYLKPTICNYFNGTAEATTFTVNCINCGSKYRVLENKILVHSESRDKINILSIGNNGDLENSTNITFDISSNLSPEYKQITSMLSIILSPCNNGYIFDKGSQQCECYRKHGYLYCEKDSTSIKLNYWFGVFSGKYTLSLCDNNYCNFFTHRKETSNGFYYLPEKIDDQCNSHRTGVACGECSEGYTLAYNSPDCINISNCSPGMIVLVIVLTILYWISIIAILFGLAYVFTTKQISLGYLYGITYFYSVSDILLATNLHKTDGIFYITTILSSFTKLNPQFLGRFCFLKNLDAIDQQFIQYCHVVFVSVILFSVYIIARCKAKAFLYLKYRMIVCYALLFSYTSIASISLPLLRAVKFDDNNDDLYTYLSPRLKYFAHRHAIYATVAIFCVLIVTISFPLLLVAEPLLMKMYNGSVNSNTSNSVKLRIRKFFEKWNSFGRIKLLLDQFKDCYKDQYRWFASYYLICRLAIMLIVYFANSDYRKMIYYLQTACVVIIMTHTWVQPYKNDALNVLDTAILLVMLLIVNLSAFSFSTSTTEGIAISLMITPLLLLFVMGVKKLFISKIKMFQANDNYPALNLISTPSCR